MTRIFQVGVGSGGMPVLDMLCRDPRITEVVVVEPDVYKKHNVERHVFPASAVGRSKGQLAHAWLAERHPSLKVQVIEADVMSPDRQHEIEAAVRGADLGICAVDSEPAKYHFDVLMRRCGRPWTLGEVLSGGIGGFVHWFIPGGPCYGCVASHLKRSVTVDKPKAPDYSQPGGVQAEVTVPASKASIEAIAALHAVVSLQLLGAGPSYDPGFTSLLFTLERVPDVFAESFRPYRFRIPRAAECLICRAGAETASSGADLDAALDQALGRLGDV